MKKLVLAVFLVLGPFFAASAQEGPIDLVLLLDTSSSMSASYREVNDYMTGSFLREFLRPGDTFHLIPFAGSPRVDVSRRVEGRGDLETIIGRMLLQYPLDPWSDIAAALSFVENYVAALPARPKKIVLLSDGDVSPQPGSVSGALDEAGLQNLINSAKGRLQGRGITLDYVKVSPGSANPLATLPVSGRPPLPVRSGVLPADSPIRESGPSEPGAGPAVLPYPGAPAPGALPADAGSGDYGGRGPAVSPGPGAPVSGTPPADAGPGGSPPLGTDPGAGPAPFDPLFPAGEDSGAGETGAAGESGLSEDGGFSAGEDSPPLDGAEPGAGPVPERLPARYEGGGLSLPVIIGLTILGLAALGLIIFLVTRRLQGTPNRAMAQAASRTTEPAEGSGGQYSEHSAALADYAANQQRNRTGPYTHHYRPPQNVPVDTYEGPLMLNLFVEDQNTFIGKRNIHAVKPGFSFTVGGGKSDFLIFLVSIPPHIGDVRCEGNRCTFIPRKSQYFPDIGSQPVPDCIGKTIRIISDKKYELHFRFERYEDPLKALNRLLHSVQVPG
ncbi:MAG: VWA domain-containing protein [Treponema sp.]|jgi:hypothetical protein|nr:VWA domain-containing protein [Treponema sp.]